MVNVSHGVPFNTTVTMSIILRISVRFQIIVAKWTYEIKVDLLKIWFAGIRFLLSIDQGREGEEGD